MSTLSNWIYAQSPVWLQNLGISLFGLAYRHERLGGDFQRHVAAFRAREQWLPDQMEQYVQSRVSKLLVTAFDDVPYYRQRWANHGLTRSDLAALPLRDLYCLPITPKADLRRDPRMFICESALGARGQRTYYTSGSTGTPITVYCSAADHRRFVAVREARSFGWAGVSIQMPRSMIGGRLVVPRHDSPAPYYRRNWAERQVYFSAYHISRDHVHNYVRGLNRYRPELLTGYAYSHFLLAQFMQDEGLRLDYQPRALILSSEKLTPEMKNTILQAFGARAYEEYGAVENCVLATECEEGRLHVNPDFGVVEIVDEKGFPVPPGHVGRVICTGLANQTQPLIRYDIGDIAAWSPNGCPCGRNHLPVLEQLVGRLEDVIVGRDGYAILRFHGIFINLPNVLEAQVIQETLDLLRIRIVVTPGFGDPEIGIMKQRLLEERLGDMEVVIERVPALERTERGKFQAVINRLPREVVERALHGRRLRDADQALQGPC